MAERRSKQEREACKQRLVEFIRYKRMSKRGFGIKAELSAQFVARFTGNPDLKARTRISQTYPELNMEWFLHGNGEMINDAYKDIPHTTILNSSNSGNVAGGNITIGTNTTDLAIKLAEANAKLLIMQERVASLETLNAKLVDMLGKLK